jgi:hypothetical protein
MDDAVTVKKNIDWGNGILHLNITKKIELHKVFTPNMKYLV